MTTGKAFTIGGLRSDSRLLIAEGISGSVGTSAYTMRYFLDGKMRPSSAVNPGNRIYLKDYVAVVLGAVTAAAGGFICPVRRKEANKVTKK